MLFEMVCSPGEGVLCVLCVMVSMVRIELDRLGVGEDFRVAQPRDVTEGVGLMMQRRVNEMRRRDRVILRVWALLSWGWLDGTLLESFLEGS